eukprot:305781-Chlamydomonas_euryale.AAC.4
MMPLFTPTPLWLSPHPPSILPTPVPCICNPPSRCLLASHSHAAEAGLAQGHMPVRGVLAPAADPSVCCGVQVSLACPTPCQ